MTPQEKRKNKEIDKLKNQYTLTFTKQELLIIFNILVSQQYKIGDAMFVLPIVKRIEPLVTMPKPEDDPKANHVLTDMKEKN